MKNNYFLFAILAVFFFSCSDDDHETRFSEVSDNYFVNDPTTSEYNLEEWQDLIGIPFYVKAVASNTYLSTKGSENKLTLTDFDEENEQLLFGISEKDEVSRSLSLISVIEMENIGVQSMNSKEELLVPVIFDAAENNTLQDTQYWRLIASENNHYSLIENATLGENEKNFVLETAENSIYLSSKKDTQNQQFEIIPKGDFEIENIQFDTEAGKVMNSEWITFSKDTVTNPTNEFKEVTVYDEYPDTLHASFIENNQQVLMPLKNNQIEIRLPAIEVIHDEINVSHGWDKMITYAENSEWKRNVGISGQSDLKIPPQTEYEITCNINMYTIEVPYEITYKDQSSGASFRKKGIWTTEFYYESETKLNEINK